MNLTDRNVTSRVHGSNRSQSTQYLIELCSFRRLSRRTPAHYHSESLTDSIHIPSGSSIAATLP
jgi:hypothetical protein